MKFIRKHLSTIIVILFLVVGLCLLLYPTVSDYWNSFYQTRAVANYVDAVQKLDKEDYQRLWKEAQEYNKTLITKPDRWHLTKKDWKVYNKLLDVGKNGIIGYIEIPKIKVSLPIYHGVDEGVLQIAIGHIAGSSLPTGGKNTHCVLSGHRGLPSAKLFTNLDQMEEGDIFMLQVLDKTLTYQVDQIRIVKPDNMEYLDIEQGKDLCTLVTCTPYGVNSHRLLVRGHRIANVNARDVGASDALQIDPFLVATAMGVPVCILLIIGVFIRTRKSRRGKGD
ncbi:class C sortase [Anaerostipes sp. MSJ-23]|uniref:class C sortase n=1 Tax=Anaerostipes sp. MSJ-23 TaxID=2841520 RepID=UPI00209CEB00|nr:class C sortase [Anaerostipes sp. MSJ-23]